MTFNRKPTKKEIYAAYGVEFAADKVVSPVGLIQPLLKNGNEKLGAGVGTWSTLAGTGVYTVNINGVNVAVNGTCCCDCVGCYAKSGRYRMTNVLRSNALHTVIARNYVGFMVRAIIAQIKADNITLCRIHAAGDFFNAEYVAAWREIIAACPECVFWTYTKYNPAEHAFDDLVNMNVVHSIIPDVGINFGHCDYILAAYEYLKAAGKSVHICRCGFDKNQHCVNCKGCSENEYVLFIEHSTNYKAEEDPLFPVVRALAMGNE